MDTSCRERSWHLCISHYWTDQISQGFIYLVRTQNFLKSFHSWHLDSLLSIYYTPFITPVCVLGVNKFYFFFGIFYVPTKWMILNRIKLFDISILLCPWNNELGWTINPYNVTCLILYLLKVSENLRFSDVFRGYKKRPVAWNELIKKSVSCWQAAVSRYYNFNPLVHGVH